MLLLDLSVLIIEIDILVKSPLQKSIDKHFYIQINDLYKKKLW